MGGGGGEGGWVACPRGHALRASGPPPFYFPGSAPGENTGFPVFLGLSEAEKQERKGNWTMVNSFFPPEYLKCCC